MERLVGREVKQSAERPHERKHGLEALADTCQRVIRERLLLQLMAVFGVPLYEPPSTIWAMEVAEDDPY